MTTVKVLKIDEKTEKSLTAVCDSALRFRGLEILSTVSAIAAAIHDQEEEMDA